AGLDAALLDETLARAAALPNLHALLVARDGTELVGRVFRGPGLDRPVNVKSVSKSVMAALTGAAIERGVLAGVEQRIAPVLGDLVPGDADPRVAAITVDHLLTMRAGLERTSGANYGRWVSSRNWVRDALSRPFVDEPGGRMLYSTGSYHLLSAVLTRAAGRSTLALAREWLGGPLGIEVPPWTRDPQGIYLGGNNMALSPRALLRFGELYRRGGAYGGRRVLPGGWIAASWTPRVRSPFSGQDYGYGWFIARARGHRVCYGWGYGGQMVYVVPDLALTAVMTSDDTGPSGRNGYVRRLHALLADGLIPAAERGAGGDAGTPSGRGRG
ncbi:MAG TPA: serine hydrolase, partial [Geminicoccaceae bacterium]|nr:serine hydrolase [Geminicoccaceae bacterium]